MKKIISCMLILCILGACIETLFAEELLSAETLLAQVPVTAYSGKEENIQTVSWGNTTNHGVSHIIFDELFRMGLLPKDMEEFSNSPTDAELEKCPKVSVEEVNQLFDRLFGQGTSARLQSGQAGIGTGNKILQLSEDGKNYIYIPYSYSGSAGNLWRTVVSETKTEGDQVIVTARYGYFCGESAAFIGSNFGLYEEIKPLSDTIKLKASDFSEEDGFFNRFHDGDFDEYLPIYKHTFKPNGDGTYYWAKTELETAGKEIPLSVLGTSVEVVSTNTASGAETDLPTSDTGTKTDLPASGSETDLPTSDTQTNLPTESDPAGSSAPTDSGTAGDAGSSPLWIYVTVGLAVAVAAALGIFFAVKKKKA